LAGAVAGAANNQLASESAGERLAKRGILFAPDYVLNAGGIISGLETVMALRGQSAEELAPLEERLKKIRERLLEIFDLSAETGQPPEQAAEMLARRLIAR
jgi:leucine dehydrogenase